VFPGTAVFIAHESGEPTLADPTVAVVYRSQERYRRRLADPAGDHCVWVIPSVRLAPVVAGLEAGAAAPRFVRTGRGAYAIQALIASALARGRPVDPLVVEEEMQAVVTATLAQPVEARTPPVAASCDEAVERARAILAGRYAEPLSLGGIAREVHVSPFHLARRFRVRTGHSLHEYRARIRLRQAVHLICAGGDDLSRVAADVGYSSHSHFSDSFRRYFGVPPSQLRRCTGTQVRTILKAVATPGP